MEKVRGLHEDGAPHLDIRFEKGGLLEDRLLISEGVPGGAIVASSNGFHRAILDSSSMRAHAVEPLKLSGKLSVQRSDVCAESLPCGLAVLRRPGAMSPKARRARSGFNDL